MDSAEHVPDSGPDAEVPAGGAGQRDVDRGGVDGEEAGQDLATLERLERELAEIEVALERVDGSTDSSRAS